VVKLKIRKARARFAFRGRGKRNAMGIEKRLEILTLLNFASGSLSRRDFLNSVVSVASGALLASPLLGCGSSYRRYRRPIRTEYNTIVHEMLDIELEHISSQKSYARLDSILSVAAETLDIHVSRRRDERETALITFETIAKVIDAYGFEYQKNGLLAAALITRKIDCDGYSFLYLGVGEILGLPIKMVRAPAHTFVRWDLEGGDYINWETTINAEKPDEYYISKHNISSASNGISAMRSLDVKKDREKILANGYVNCGVEWLKRMRLKEAIERFDQAIERDPFYEAPYYNKGLVFYHLDDMPRAITWCKKAVSLNPNHMKSHAVLGTAYMVINDRENAKKHFRRVRELDPEYYATKITEMRLTSRN
jgi:tetratricopeptide (TPR) repeat protein